MQTNFRVLLPISLLMISGILTAATSEHPVASAYPHTMALSTDSVLKQFYFADPGRHENKLINYTVQSSLGELSSTSSVLHPSDCLVMPGGSTERFCNQTLNSPETYSRRAFQGSQARTAGMLTHVIQEGEDLDKIVSLYYGNPDGSASVAAFNQLSLQEAKALKPGNTLKIPVRVKLSSQ